MILRSQPPRWCQSPSPTSSSATMLRIIFIAATTLFLASVALPALMSAAVGAENYEDVVGNIHSITPTPSLLLRGSGIHHNSRRLKDKNKKKKPVVVEEKDDDDDDFEVNAAKALIDEASTTKTTTAAAAESATSTTTKNKGGGDAETAAIAVSSTPIEKQHEAQEEAAEEAGHTSMAQEIEETNNEKEKQQQQPIESMEEDMLMEELDEVLDEIDALDLNNTHGENEAKIEELEEEEMELVEEIFEEEGDNGDDDTYEYDYNDDVITEVVKEEELEKIAGDDPTGKISQELALAEEIGELEDTIEDIENEDDDGASAMIKEDYVEGLKEEEQMILHEIVDEASGGGKNSSMILDKIQEIGTLAKEVENEEDDDDDDYVDSSIWEEGKKEVEEGFQIIENALEEELVSEMNNASKGGGDEESIIDPTLTMDLTQYNDESSETKSNTEMELVSPQVKESQSEPLKIDTEPDRDKLGDDEEDVALAAEEGGEEEESGTTEEEGESTKNGASTEAETATESTVASKETTTTTATTTTPETVVISTPAPTPEETTTPPPPAPVKDPGHWGTTAKPTIAYVEPIDESLDPISNEENTSNEAFADGKAKSESSAATGTNDESMEEWEEEVEEEVKKVGGWLSFVFMILMIYTAYQMSENPDGICASLCRLVITVIGCILKVALIPCKYILGGGRPSGGHYMATPDYRDPYGSRHMELT
ncbi:hypothetical protein ACHAWC_010494 [Mediolabrus comicus]